MFLALKGEAYDGHDYLATALEAGACAAIVQRHDAAVDLPQFVLGDTRQALLRIATAWRRLVQLPVKGVTGRHGKAPAKDMIESIFLRALGGKGRPGAKGN